MSSRRRTSPAWGIGLATVTADGQVLDTWFPTGQLGLGDAAGLAAGRRTCRLPPAALGDRRCPACVRSRWSWSIGSLADPPKDAADAYLRLHLLSHRLVRPHEANLDGIFGLLANVAWTSAGPCPPERVDELRLIERGRRPAAWPCTASTSSPG